MKRFGRLPPEVKAFGRPLSVHAPNWLSTLTWVGHVVVIVGLMIATAVSLTLSQVQANVAGVYPDAWQLIASGTCFFGLVAFVSGRSPTPAAARPSTPGPASSSTTKRS